MGITVIIVSTLVRESVRMEIIMYRINNKRGLS